jgi:hypothetical protein
VALSEKTGTIQQKLLMSFFLKPLSNLVSWQMFRIFGHSLADIQGLEGSLYTPKMGIFLKKSTIHFK